MLSEYRDVLEKRRLERKKGHNPVPDLPPFVPLPKDELAHMPPSSPASYDFEPYYSRESISLSRRSPSVYSRQSVNASSPPPPPARSRSIITPPPLALASANDMGSGQRSSSPHRPSYLSQLAPFSVTPRKRLFTETTMIAVEASATKDGDDGQPRRTRRTLSVTAASETQAIEYPEQSPMETPAAAAASIPETEHRNNSEDVDMADANTHNTAIPEIEQPLLPAIEQDDAPENLSIHDLSIHEESHLEDETHNSPSATARAKSPQASSTSVEPLQPIATTSPQQQNEPQQHVSRDDAEKPKETQGEAAGSVEPQEPVLQENVENPTKNAYQTVIEEEEDKEEPQKNLDESQQEADASIEAAKVTDQTTTVSPHPLNTEDPAAPQESQIKYGFEDNDIDYGGYDDVDEGKSAASMSQAGDQASQAGGQASQTGQAEGDTPNDILRNLRTMATASTLNLKKIRKLSNLHIKTISNLVLDSTMEARNNTTDAHEKSVIEDYYYTVNDDLKQCHKNYLQYQQCASANRRLRAYHRKKDLQFLHVIKEENTLNRRIHDLRLEIQELDAKQNTWTRIEDLFHDINQIKGTTATVTKQV